MRRVLWPDGNVKFAGGKDCLPVKILKKKITEGI
jgi:hypothetical protein